MKMKCFYYPQSFTLIIDVKFNFQIFFNKRIRGTSRPPKRKKKKKFQENL